MTIIRKRFTHTLLPALLAAFAGFAACSSDDDAPEPPKPSGYDIYTAGYTTPASKAVATVWKNGQLLYTLTNGTNDAWAYAVCVSDGTVYAAGYERQGDRIVLPADLVDQRRLVERRRFLREGQRQAVVAETQNIHNGFFSQKI